MRPSLDQLKIESWSRREREGGVEGGEVEGWKETDGVGWVE